MEAVLSTAEKTAKGKKKRDKRRAHRPKFSVHGRPSKRTPQLEKALLAAIRTGAPYRIACMACGISDDAFTNWRRADPIFSEQVEKASGQTALRLLKKIEAQGRENFSACAWLLERRFPESFSRPEVQLNLIQNNMTLASGGGGADRRLEAVIVSDLEFSALSENSAYRHQTRVSPVRDIEAQVVPEDLSGNLVRSGYPDAVVISQRQHDENERRLKMESIPLKGILHG
jgi:hypothetical protein